MTRLSARLALAALVLVTLSSAAIAQSPNCATIQGTATTALPSKAGTLPSSGDLSLGGGSSYLYVLTQWGMARASLSNPANPGPYNQVVLSSDGGDQAIIPLACDCHQGWNTFAVAEGPTGTSRMIGDWQPYAQGGPPPPPPNSSFSGLPAMVTQTTGAGSPVFGQQIALSARVPLGSRIAAMYAAPSSKYFGYFPVKGSGVYVADLTSPSGSPSFQNPMNVTSAIGWNSPSGSGLGVRLKAAHVTVSGYDKYLLVGTTTVDTSLHVAEINTANGIPTEVASAPISRIPAQLEIAVVNNRIFIFSAENSEGLQVYEFQPPNVLMLAGSLPGDIDRVIVRGPQPYPALFFMNNDARGDSFVDVYDTKWLTQGGSPLFAASIPHLGAGPFTGPGIEAQVVQNGSAIMAYLYREQTPPPPGLPVAQSPIHTTAIDISCIAADPTAPPVANAVMTNLSAASRQSPENTKNYYGDKWEIKDASSSGTIPPLTNIQWDINTGATGPFAADAAWSGAPTPSLMDILPAYWPCDPASAGNLTSGAGCWASLGSPAGGNYTLGLKTSNANGASAPYFSGALAVAAPTLSILGYNGNVLQVLAGNPNNGDASASKGNVAEAGFAWTFTPSGSAAGPVVTIPTAATAFSLTATYKGGYATTKSGTIQQVDLVPSFSLSPNPVLKSGSLTLRNLMQKATAANLVTVSYSIDTSPPSGNVLATSFYPANGTASITAPAVTGSFSVTLDYSYTDHNGNAQHAFVSLPFTVTDFAPSPILVVCTNNSVPCTSPVAYFGGYSLTTGTQYYLSDGETIPGGAAHPGSAYWKSSNNSQSTSGDQSLGTAAGAGPVAFTPATCATSCYVKVSVPASGGTLTVWPYTAAPSGGGGGGNNPSLTLAGPVTGTTAAAVTFTATSSNFPGAVTFTWDFGDTASGGGGGGGGGGGCPPILVCLNAPLGEATTAASDVGSNSHAYVNIGTHTVKVTATAGTTTLSKSATIAITQGGPPQPLATYTLAGASQNALSNTWDVDAGSTITFTASEDGANVSTAPDAFAWDFGDGATATGRTVTHAYARPGSDTATLTVTGDGTNRVGTSTAQIRFTVATPSFQALMIPGAGSIEAASGTWATDISVTNPGTATTTVTLYFAAFSDVIPTDLSTLPFSSLNSVALEGGQSWSGVDVVRNPLNRPGAGKGILFLKYDGGNATPIVTARVYFTADGASYGTALPSYVVGPFGQTQAQGTQTVTGQILSGLRNDALYRFNVSLFNASADGGLFHLDAFSEDGAPVASKDFAVPGYSQAGINDTDLFTPDPAKRYVLRVSSTAGALQAFASQLDRRNNDLVQISDDTPRVNVAPDTVINYYISGVGRIEDGNAHWRTDLRFFNPSSLQRTLTLEYHYTPTGSTAEQIVLAPLSIGAGQGVSLDDVVGQYLDDYTPADLKTGTVLGLLKVYYHAPTDAATAPLIIGGRIYADLPTGTAGMQLSVYTQSQSVSPGSSRLVMPGAQTNLRFRTNIGVFALGDLPTVVRIFAIKKDGSQLSTYDYTLNNPGSTGAFAQIPMTALPVIDGEPMTIKVQSVSGSPVGAYIVTVDQISSDTVFIQGKPVS